MTTAHGPHVTDLTRHFSMCQEFPEEHIQCLLTGSCEGTRAPEMSSSSLAVPQKGWTSSWKELPGWSSPWRHHRPPGGP